MKGMKVSELKAFLYTLTEEDNAVVTKEFMSGLFDAFGDEYGIIFDHYEKTDENAFKSLVLSKAKGGESK